MLSAACEDRTVSTLPSRPTKVLLAFAFACTASTSFFRAGVFFRKAFFRACPWVLPLPTMLPILSGPAP